MGTRCTADAKLTGTLSEESERDMPGVCGSGSSEDLAAATSGECQGGRELRWWTTWQLHGLALGHARPAARPEGQSALRSVHQLALRCQCSPLGFVHARSGGNGGLCYHPFGWAPSLAQVQLKHAIEHDVFFFKACGANAHRITLRAPLMCFSLVEGHLLLDWDKMVDF